MDVARELEARTDRIEVSTDVRVAKNDGCSELAGQREVHHEWLKQLQIQQPNR